MPKNKPPKVLPAIKFDPPFNGDTGTGWRGEQGGAGKGDSLTGLQYNPINYYNPSARNMPEGTDMGNGQAAYPNPAYNPLPPAQPPAYGPRPDEYVQNPAFLQGRDEGATGLIGEQAAQDRPTQPPAGDPMAGPGNDQVVSQWQATLDKNRGLNEKATAAGDTKEMARLQAEWDRIAPKAAKYGITADRLINSYMQPGNPAAETSLDRAMGRAIADDTWAEAATLAFKRPPNQLEWDEHWRAMNQGGRDPLEGHPAAIQAIQAKMQEIEQENQNEAYGQYQQWLANQ
jgi:hypothetical protein